MLVDWCEEQYQLSMIHGVSDYAKENDLNFLCFEGGGIQAPFEYESRRNIVYDLVNNQIIDGLVILSPSIGHYVDYTAITKFCSKFISMPLVSIALAIPNTHSVITDNFGGMRDLIAHFIKVHDCRNFAFIKGPESSQDARDRFNSFQETLLDFGIRPDPNLIVDGNFVADSGEAAIRTLLDERKAEFDVVIAANDNMALGALHELNARGIKVPEEVSLAGFDNLDFSVHTEPPLTTVSYSLYNLGWRAAETLIHLIQNKEVPRETILPANLIIRRSCGCFSHQLNRTALDVPELEQESSHVTISKHKHRILAHVIEQTHYYFNNKEDINFNGMIEKLFDAFLQEFTSARQGSFLKELSAVFENTAWVSRDIFTWQSVITELRRNLLPYLYDLDDISLVENLWHQARVLIGSKALIQEKLSYQQYIKANQIINTLREELLFTLDQTQIFNILASKLPDLGIICF